MKRGGGEEREDEEDKEGTANVVSRRRGRSQRAYFGSLYTQFTLHDLCCVMNHKDISSSARTTQRQDECEDGGDDSDDVNITCPSAPPSATIPPCRGMATAMSGGRQMSFCFIFQLRLAPKT